MNIVVCVKQVPDTAHLKFDANNQLMREGVENIMNPFDEYAVETAIRLKEAHEGSKVTVISMGPAQAKEVLKRAIAMGCDDAFLLSDDAFNGADSWASANTLKHAIQKLVPDFDLVLTGQFATDDMSGITGPALAEFLGVPSVTFCKRVDVADPKTVQAHREVEQGVEVFQMALPGVLCMMKCDYEPRIPSIKGVMKANRTEIPTHDAAAIGLPTDQAGANGSTTVTLKTWRRPKKEGGKKIDGADPQVAVNELIGFLRERKVI